MAVAGAIVGPALDADPGPAPRASTRSRPARSRGALLTTAGVASGGASAPCGPASAATIASVDSTVAQAIYAAELHSNEVSADIAHITGSQALLSALASNNEAAVRSAVHTIVYMPHWHIVRLRVLKAGRVVADVGGPYIIAPVSGALRWKGRTVGTYVMSVQDDAGYVKLVSRFIGVPIDLYRNGSFLMGTLQPAPTKVSAGASVSVSGASYYVQLLNARAFPSGTLSVALLVPTPSSSVSATSCSAVRLAAWGSIAMHIAARFKPLQTHYQDLVDVLRGATGGPAFVRSGSRRIAGGAVPARLPSHGIVRYGGRSWSVFSWEPVPPARVYFLTPTS
ncbi:MAG TPA: hypothetical protein VK272_03310 [Solirubrobacteraceae bacterium]|nr:hypothetical protein [Solirubrobacteraceae bacterium]